MIKRLLNTLYITDESCYLKKEGETITILKNKEKVAKLPALNIGSIICFGGVTMSPHLMFFCAQEKISISFISITGRFLARVEGPVSGNVLLRKSQYKYSDDKDFSSNLAANIIRAKLHNCRIVLSRFVRDQKDHADVEKIEKAANYLKSTITQVNGKLDIDSIRGLEGDGAKKYFEVFDSLILHQKESFFMKGRNRRPPLDNVNAMLSYLYTILTHEVRSALETVGLDVAVGFLHQIRPGRPSLALDLMEEFRPFLVDRLVLKIINLKQIKPEHFTVSQTGSVLMSPEGKKILISAYQERKKEEVEHPFLNEKIPIGLIPYSQALIFSRYIRGDYEAYPPFLWS